METLIKLLHIASVSLWLAGALYLPQIFRLHSEAPDDAETGRLIAMARRLYFGLMTPAGIIAVLLGTWLIYFGFEGGWLPTKLSMVLLLTLFHLYCGRLLLLLEKRTMPHRARFFGALTFVPLPLLGAIVTLAVAKPF